MIGERIKKLRKSLDLTQQEFSEKIGIKRNTIAKYETGRGDPIDAVVSLICREFNVSEEWLRTGNGEMFVRMSRDKEVMNFMERSLQGESDSFRKRFISMLSRLDDSDWEVLEKMAMEMVRAKSADEGGIDPAVATMPDDLSTEAAEALYRSSSGYVPSADLSASNTTSGTESAEGTKGA